MQNRKSMFQKISVIIIAMILLLSNIVVGYSENYPDYSLMSVQELRQLEADCSRALETYHTISSSQESSVLSSVKEAVKEALSGCSSLSWPWFDYEYTRDWDYFTLTTSVDYKTASKEKKSSTVYAELFRQEDGTYTVVLLKLDDSTCLDASKSVTDKWLCFPEDIINGITQTNLSALSAQELHDIHTGVTSELKQAATPDSKVTSFLYHMVVDCVEQYYKSQDTAVDWPWSGPDYSRERELYRLETKVTLKPNGGKSITEHLSCEAYYTFGKCEISILTVGDNEIIAPKASAEVLSESTINFQPTAAIEDSESPTIEPTTSGTEIVVAESSAALVSNQDYPPNDTASFFEVHFLDVGQGDSALVICDGHSMLIDGGSPSASSMVYSYLKKCGIDHLDYIIGTHPDSDHMGGLSGALNYATVSNAYSSVWWSEEECWTNFKEYLSRQNITPSVPTTGTIFPLGSAEVTVLGPIVSSSGDNNNSLVLRVQYGETSFLFTGDAEEAEETSLVNNNVPHSTLLKVSHHGSNNSSTSQFLDAVQPEYAIISAGKDNPYWHPGEITLNRLRERNINVYRTDLQGTIIVRSDGTKLNVSVEKGQNSDVFIAPALPVQTDAGSENRASPEPTKQSTQTNYVLNTNTLKFHYPTCSSAHQIKDKNRQDYTGTREEIIAMGYTPCGKCHP